MSEHEEKRDKERNKDTLSGQGNMGLYGQGQYDSEGKPDPRTKQAQQLHQDQLTKKKPAPQRKEYDDQDPCIPGD